MAAVITGTGPAELKALAVKLRLADPELTRELRRNLTEAARPTAAAVQRSILDMPARTEEGLRAEVAATVRTSVTTGRSSIQIAIASYGSRMPSGKSELPRYLDAARGWAHPVFGHRDRWVRQLGKPQWFERPVADDYYRLVTAAEAALDETAAMITR